MNIIEFIIISIFTIFTIGFILIGIEFYITYKLIKTYNHYIPKEIYKEYRAGELINISGNDISGNRFTTGVMFNTKEYTTGKIKMLDGK